MLISFVSFAVAPSLASEEEFVPWQSVSIVCKELPAVGKVALDATVRNDRFRSLEIQAFGRTYRLAAADLEKLRNLPLSSLRITHEAGYKMLGGHMVNLRFKRLYYKKDLIEETAVVSVFKEKNQVAVTKRRNVLKQASEPAHGTDAAGESGGREE